MVCSFAATCLVTCDSGSYVFAPKEHLEAATKLGLGDAAKVITIDTCAVQRNGSIFSADQSLYKKLLEQDLKTGTYRINVILDTAAQAILAAQAIVKTFPVFCLKTVTVVSVSLHVTFETVDKSIIDYEYVQIIANAASHAKKLVEMPTNYLDTSSYLDHVKKVHEGLIKFGVTLKVILGEDLKNQGFGGLWNVGKAAEFPPALAILSFTPKNAVKTVAWVGKGIVYDTGGLSIKVGGNMCGMKTDMGGSASVLAGFEAYVLSSVSAAKVHNVHALLCLAENAIGRLAVRNDDVITMYSGKTVELNNTDAEGRLVLGDGVAYATKHLNPDVILDIATLTGACLINTGKRYAGIVCNDDDLEHLVVAAGKRTGNLVFPMLYAPEILFHTQFSSKVADMKNSVKDRANAQASCAGHFIESHLVGDKWDHSKNQVAGNLKGLWCHIDIAGVASDADEMGTGYGPALLNEITRQL